MNSQDLKYEPTFMGRISRIIIPFLQLILPKNWFKFVYDLLYRIYKWLTVKSYLLILAWSYLFDDHIGKARARLTWRLLPFTMGGRKALENAFNVVALIESKGVPGVLVECGVAEGGTAAMLALANQELGTFRREKWFFDSYEGLPEPTEEDYINGKAGRFIRPLPKGACLGTIEQVHDLMFVNLRFSQDEVHLVKGWFQDTIAMHKEIINDSIAVLRLDGDWYDSTKIPLENFYDMVSIGGIIIIDDYCTCFGSERATNEFRDSRGITAPLIPDGRGGVWFQKV